MGLDMYLSASRYVSGYDHNKEIELERYTAILAASRLPRCASCPSLTVTAHVAYWRKANAIHGWFVDNVQDGEDKCQKSYVSREQLQKLLDACIHAKATKDTEKLCPREGFFFGSYEIDDNYWYDIDDTITQLTAILADPLLQDCDYEYQASW